MKTKKAREVEKKRNTQDKYFKFNSFRRYV